jgi:hypothetical protein
MIKHYVEENPESNTLIYGNTSSPYSKKTTNILFTSMNEFQLV